MSKQKIAKISISIPESLLEELRKMCEEEHRTVSGQIALLVEQAIKARKGDAS
ncbi:ribbon-helix-helix protein, CopG family [Chroococcidiopsis sp. FACHB-1243]|uniref:ribbon-helix-helix domain-containing protein n=1 Tax=Chroococcidiopsis sp. [FACHB-1243] TaxID=2692781 RepID=UPI00177CFE90|nr:ribbon-helix-helix protein, CopG family [Chroococcidiopsis sp. [FACHB-1243]]MBD2305054.1 ribbon-helix-helix protein, CopG family [Chroococcidiopsis sp. [FACHB-1243]]